MKENFFYSFIGYLSYGMGLISILLIFKPRMVSDLMIYNVIAALIWSLVLTGPAIWGKRKSVK